VNEIVDSSPSDQSDEKVQQSVMEMSQSLQSQAMTLEVQMRCLEKNLLPCTPLRFLDWVLTQRESFYEDESGLFLSLFRDEMKATPQQLQQVLDLKKVISERGADKIKDQVVLSAFRAFDQLIRAKGSLIQSDYFERLRKIFTPQQLSVYFKWHDTNAITINQPKGPEIWPDLCKNSCLKWRTK